MIPVIENIFLDKLKYTDADAIVGYMRDKLISETISVIPFPYTHDDAKWFLDDTLILEEETGVQKNYAIRNGNGMLLGIIGIHLNYPTGTGKSEFGYWLGKPHRGKELMTAVVNKFIEVAKQQHGITQLEAHAFDFNKASMNLLLKTGFINTGEIKTTTRKDGTKGNAIKFTQQQTP